MSKLHVDATTIAHPSDQPEVELDVRYKSRQRLPRWDSTNARKTAFMRV
jgi:hypothetical protein